MAAICASVDRRFRLLPHCSVDSVGAQSQTFLLENELMEVFRALGRLIDILSQDRRVESIVAHVICFTRTERVGSDGQIFV